MRTFPMNIMAWMALLATVACPLAAQASRTWVSGVGDDVNPCSRTAPCKTFAGAISKTAALGEINVLDPGGYGAVTITKSITIDGSGGSVAGVLASGSSGIVINAGSNDTVVLRNLDINGLQVQGSTPSTLRGIAFLAGKQLIVEKCNIYGFGLRNISIETTASNASVFISNTILHDSLSDGIVIVPPTSARVVLDHVQAVNNGNVGLVVGSGAVQVRDSIFSNNLLAGVDVHGAGVADLMSSVISNNGNGIQTFNSPIVRISGVAIIDNFNAGITIGGGAIYSYGNNQIDGNPFNIGSVTPIGLR